MGRTLGAIDKVTHRKPRSDIGKKRKRYKGQPCKHKKKSYYYKRRKGNKDSIILRMFWRVPMTRDGYKNWKVHARPKLYKEVTKMQPPIRVDVERINTKKKIEEFVANNYWNGKFVVMGVSHGKTKTHTKWVHICTIVVKETPEGNVGKMIVNKRLSKYGWFYKG